MWNVGEQTQFSTLASQGPPTRLPKQDGVALIQYSFDFFFNLQVLVQAPIFIPWLI